MVLEIRRLGKRDASMAGEIISDIKNAAPDDTHTERFLANPMNIFLAALVDGCPARYAMAYELERADAQPNMVFFYEIEVAEPYQKQGIGRALVDTLKSYCKSRNAGKMFVLSDRRNTAARALYAATGGREEYDDGVLVVYSQE